MVQEAVARVTTEDTRLRAVTALRDSIAEGALGVEDSLTVELITPSTEVAMADGLVDDNNDLRVLPPSFAVLGDSLRPVKGHEAINISVRFQTAGDSVKVIVVGYVDARDGSGLTRFSLQEGTATATARFDEDGFWATDLIFPSAGAQFYQVRLEAPTGVVKVFASMF